MTGLEDSEIGTSRYAGYQHGLKNNGLTPDGGLVYRGNYSYEAGLEGANYFLSLKQPPSAIICANDAMALGAMKQFNRQGQSIPNDISIIGFDDIEVASQIDPALTTVAAPVEEIARNAVETLKNLIENKPPQHQHIALKAQLIIRQSCTWLKKATFKKAKAA